MAIRRLGSRAHLGEGEIIGLIISPDQYWISLTLEHCEASGPRHPRIAGPVKPSISTTVEIEASLHFRAKGLANAQRVPLATQTPPTLAFRGSAARCAESLRLSATPDFLVGATPRGSLRLTRRKGPAFPHIERPSRQAKRVQVFSRMLFQLEQYVMVFVKPSA